MIDRDVPMLRAAAYRILGNAFDADEAIQNALLSAWRKFDSFNHRAKLSSWVYRITVNACYDLLYQKRREQEKLERYARNIPEQSAPDSRLEDLERAVAELPVLYREAISIGYLSGFDGERAAEILECSVNTLYQRIHKAKQLLKQKMERIEK